MFYCDDWKWNTAAFFSTLPVAPSSATIRSTRAFAVSFASPTESEVRQVTWSDVRRERLRAGEQDGRTQMVPDSNTDGCMSEKILRPEASNFNRDFEVEYRRTTARFTDDVKVDVRARCFVVEETIINVNFHAFALIITKSSTEILLVGSVTCWVRNESSNASIKFWPSSE